MKKARANIPIEARQRILDWLNEHGEMSARQLAEALDMNRSTIGNYLGWMRNDNELTTREEGGRTHFVVIYSALVKTTKALQPKINDTVANHPIIKQFRILGRKTYLGNDRDRPLPNAGGQGCVHEPRGIASSADWI